MTRMRIRAEGAAFDDLDILIGTSSCGSIRDGVAVDEMLIVADGRRQRNAYVLDWNDFEAAYLAMKAYRESLSSGDTGGEK